MEEYVLKIKQFFDKLVSDRTTVEKDKVRDKELIDLIRKAHREWQVALNNFNYYIDQDLIDYSIYNIEAAEKKYMCLIKRAQKEKLTVDLPMPE